MATSQSGGTVDIDTCSASDNKLVDAENHKNETARFTFSQIHQYLQYGAYPSDFHGSDKQGLTSRLCERDQSSLRALMAISTMLVKVSDRLAIHQFNKSGTTQRMNKKEVWLAFQGNNEGRSGRLK